MRGGAIGVTVVNDTEAIADLIADLLADRSRFRHPKLLNEPSMDEIAATEPDLIFLGLRTNGRVHGWNVLDAIRGDARLSSVPVILCTGDLHALRDRISGADPGPCTEVLEKPFDLETFQATVDRALVSTPSDDRIGGSVADGPV